MVAHAGQIIKESKNKRLNYQSETLKLIGSSPILSSFVAQV
jgi:hypothetical protein